LRLQVESGGLIDLGGRHCRHQVDRRSQDEMSVDGSGQRSRQASRVKMLRLKLVCRRP
jgi:hypothetical protein